MVSDNRVRHTLGAVLAEISNCTFQCVIRTRAFSLSVDSTHNFSFSYLCPSALPYQLPLKFYSILSTVVCWVSELHDCLVKIQAIIILVSSWSEGRSVQS